MTGTEVRVKLMDGERLLAFASITFDNEFVVRDLKVILGTKGPFVAMPSRKLADKCPSCQSKCFLQDHFCSRCGLELDPERATRDELVARVKLHADIAHPITAKSRAKIQDTVLDAYRSELARSKEPGYVSRYDDILGDPA